MRSVFFIGFDRERQGRRTSANGGDFMRSLFVFEIFSKYAYMRREDYPRLAGRLPEYERLRARTGDLYVRALFARTELAHRAGTAFPGVEQRRLRRVCFDVVS